MPWVWNGKQTGRPERPRELGFLLSRTEALSNVVGHLKKSSNDWLREQDPQLAQFFWQAGFGAFSELSQPFRPHPSSYRLPRASAFGLSPGLHSPGPLGRVGQTTRSKVSVNEDRG